MNAGNQASTPSSAPSQKSAEAVEVAQLLLRLRRGDSKEAPSTIINTAPTSLSARKPPIITYSTSINSAADQNPPEERQHTVSFFLTWESIIIAQDNCFLYTDDERSAAIFTYRMNGQTPEAFAFAALRQKTHEAFTQAAANGVTNEELVPVMLGFWKQRSKIWRQQFRSKEAAREDFQQRREHLKLLPELFARRINRTEGGYLSLGPCQVGFGKEGHLRTSDVVAVLVDGEMYYDVVQTVDCHEDCEVKRDVDALREKLEEREDEDLKLLLAAKGLEEPMFKS